jgi:hypothetical protein
MPPRNLFLMYILAIHLSATQLEASLLATERFEAAPLGAV